MTTMPTGLRPSVLQALRAARMIADGSAHTEYSQPAHTFIAQKLPNNPELHRQVALPGAKRAVHLAALEEFHARGLSDAEIVKEINVTIDTALQTQRQKFIEWRDGEHAEHLALARERDQRRQQMLAARLAQIDAELDRQVK